MKKLNLNESFISRIWTSPEYYEDLKTLDNKSVEILSYGIPNNDAGADFKETLIKIDGIIYSGDIEIHKSFSDWDSHKHKADAKYNKVILEVVFWEDENAAQNSSVNKRKIPTVILSKFLKTSIHNIWQEIINNPSPKFQIPCFKENTAIESDFKRNWLDDLGSDRLIYRMERIKNRISFLSEENELISKKYIWEKVFIEYTFEALGFSKNKSQFLKLSRILNLRKIKQYCTDLKSFDSTLFYVSGFLNKQEDDSGYVTDLKNIWKELSTKLKPETMDKSEWNFFRLRPKNFPTVRLAIASGLCYEVLQNDLFKRIIFCAKSSKNLIKDISDIFSNLEFSEYWKSHYDFNKANKSSANILGKERIYDIIINVIIPILYFYSKSFNDEELFIKVKKVYKTTKDKSKNTILEIMKNQLGVTPQTISESQGMLHLHNFYCVKGNCGECKIGEKVFDKFSVKDVLQIILY